jgi:hypothetical protein
MGIKADVYLGGALALVLLGIYVDRKYTQAGGASGIASNVAGVLWDSAVNSAQAVGGSLLDAMPSSQVASVVDQVQVELGPNARPDPGTLLYESALMGGGS